MVFSLLIKLYSSAGSITSNVVPSHFSKRPISAADCDLRIESIITQRLSNSWLSILGCSSFTTFITPFIEMYENSTRSLTSTVRSTISAASNASAAESLYASINPDTPNFVPPKYLTTTIKQLVTPRETI